MQPHKQGYRRLICLLLCVAMMLSLGVTAFAEDADPSTLETAERALVLDYGFESIENGAIEDLSGNGFDGEVVSLTAVEEPSMLLHYDFAGDTGSMVTDKVGNYNGELTTANGGEAKLIYGANRDGGQAAEFVRGSAGQQGGYLEMPAKAFADAGSELTLNTWVKLDDLPNWTQLMSIGTDRSHYFVLAASGNPYGKGVGLTAAMKNGGAEERIAAPQSATVTPGQWAMVTYVQSATSAALYVNGQKLNTTFYDASMNPADGSAYLKMSVAAIAGLEGAKAQLGRSICFSDNNLDGMVGEVQLYRGALSDEAISKLMSSGAENSKQVLHYDFVGDTGTTATDKASSYNGTLKTANDGEAKFDAAANIGGDQALELVRGSSKQNGGYVEVPVDVLKKAGRKLTVNLWVRPDDNPNWNQLFGVGSDSTHYALLASNGNPYNQKVGLTVALRNGGSEERIAAPSGVTLTTSEWNMVTYVESESDAALYLNGQKLDTRYYDAQMNASVDGSEYLKVSFAAVAAAANASAQIGRSPCFKDNNFDGIVGDFALYQGALTGAEIEKLYSEKTAQLDEDAIRQTKEYLEKTYNGTKTKNSLTLPVTGVKGTQIKWTASSNAAVMAPDGTLVSRPDADARITLTAKLRCGTAEGECRIEVTVLALTAAIMAEEDAAWAAEYLDFIVNDTQTTLPETAPYGSALTWSVTSGHGEIRDGVLYKTEGAAENEPLTLSVKAAIKGAEKTAPVTGLILKDAYVGQIMSYFTNSADDRGMKLSYTYDLKNFMPLNNGKAVVAMTQGTKRMRDPSVFRLKDGTFGVVSTQGWDNPSIYVVDSPDLCSFENEHLVKVANGARAWAPECNYDRLTGQYIVYWSDPYRDGGYIRYNTSPDLVTFSAEQKYIGFDYSVIDASIKWAEGKYYMAIKREDGGQAYDKGGYGTLIMASADRLTGPWTCSEEFIAGKLAPNNASKNWCEGPTWSKSYADGLYYMYFDEAAGRDVIFATNTDMADDSGWKYHDNSEYGGIAAKKVHGNTESLDSADKRTSHCGITDVTQKELDRLIAKWGVTSEAYGIWFTILNARNPEAVEAVKGTAFDALELPETVSVQYDDGGWRDVAVTWDENGYDASVDRCELTGTIVLADDVKNSKNITVTCVVRLTAVNKDALNKAIEEAKELTESDYTAESWQPFAAALKKAEEISSDAGATAGQVTNALAELNNAFAGLTQITPPTPIIPVTPSEPAKNPFNPNAGANTTKFPFADVPSDSWYYSSVKAAWENNLIDGVTANEFKPNATLTVAQTIKLAAALHQLDRTGEVSLKNGGANWYDSYVNYAVVNGIIEKDYANYTKAQMNAPVTRGEFVHIFHGAEEAYKAINTVADNAIPDVKATDKFAPEIYEFYRAGILTGSDAKGTFHSASTIKRSEAAAILLRMFEASARKSITLN